MRRHSNNICICWQGYTASYQLIQVIRQLRYKDYARGLEDVLKLNLIDMFKILRLGLNRTNFSGKTCFFPPYRISTGSLSLSTLTLSADRFAAIKELGKKYKATVNDVLLAAFYRALFSTLEFEAGKNLEVSMTVDLRRYLHDKEEAAIRNLKSMIPIKINYDPAQTFN